MNDWQVPHRPTGEGKYALAQMRHEYCQDLYNREVKRQEKLEQKSQFYLSFITIFLGSILFNIDFLEKFASLVNKSGVPAYLIWTIYGLMALSGFFIFSALVCILESIRIQFSTSIIPKDITRSLFHASYEYLDREIFLKDIAGRFSIALEDKIKINNKKAQLLSSGGFFILGLNIALFFLVSSFVFLLFNF